MRKAENHETMKSSTHYRGDKSRWKEGLCDSRARSLNQFCARFLNVQVTLELLDMRAIVLFAPPPWIKSYDVIKYTVCNFPTFSSFPTPPAFTSSKSRVTRSYFMLSGTRCGRLSLHASFVSAISFKAFDHLRLLTRRPYLMGASLEARRRNWVINLVDAADEESNFSEIWDKGRWCHEAIEWGNDHNRKTFKTVGRLLQNVEVAEVGKVKRVLHHRHLTRIGCLCT